MEESLEKRSRINTKKVKSFIKSVLIFLVAAMFGYGIGMDIRSISSRFVNNTTVSFNGWLTFDGSKMKNERGKEIQLRGVSSHGIQWFSELYTYEDIKELKEWGVDVFRIAMYSDPNANGYVKNKELKNKVEELIDACISLDMYVVVDWHILDDNNPLKYKKEANEFFDEISRKYADVPNIIYEICNEPNGDTGWGDIKKYADEVISTIRNNSSKSMIIVGTPNWSRDLAAVTNDPLNYQNIAYALHFYAGSDNVTLRDKIDDFRSKGYAVVVSECGSTDASGDGGIFADNFDIWANYLNEKGISWIYWSLANKAESSAMLRSDYLVVDKSVSRNRFDNYLSESGLLVKKYFN